MAATRRCRRAFSPHVRVVRHLLTTAEPELLGVSDAMMWLDLGRRPDLADLVGSGSLWCRGRNLNVGAQRSGTNEVHEIAARPTTLTWPSRPDVTLIGDAAHLMPPVGEGANQAMLDAAELGRALIAAPTTAPPRSAPPRRTCSPASSRWLRSPRGSRPRLWRPTRLPP